MYFKKESIKNYRNSDININIERCQHYILFDKTQIAGHFYCGLESAVGIIEDTFIIIRTSKSSILKRKFEFINAHNNSIVGQLTISNFVAFTSLRIIFDIIHKDPYQWEVDKSEKGFSLFTSKTFSIFCGRLFNDKEKLTVKWNYKSNTVLKHRLEDLPVEGELELEESKNFILMFAGLFLAEMELQLKSVG